MLEVVSNAHFPRTQIGHTYPMGAFCPREDLTSVLHSPVRPLSIYPGETVFTRANVAHSTASDLPYIEKFGQFSTGRK